MREHNKHTVSHKNGRMTFLQLLENIAQTHGWKAVLSVLLSFLAVNLATVAGFLAVGILLVAADLYTGVKAARYRHEEITSRKMRKTIDKIIMYCIAIVLVMIVEKTFFNSDYLVYLVSAYVSIVELKSNLENIKDITGTDILSVVSEAISIKNIFRKK